MNDESASPSAKAAETIFNAALAFNAAERPIYLAGACGDNLALRQRVEDLLRAHEASPGFLPEAPPSSRPTIKLEFAAAEDEAVGQTIGRYKLLEKLGEGGCGVVYVAEQTEPVRRRVALKVIKLGMDTKAVVARFEAERQALALMDHPNIAKILDAGTTGTGRPFFVMELVKGIPITRYCDESNLSTVKRLGLFVQVCQAIQHAHQKGIIHRDIKPTNVLVADHDGVPVPKVIDFGIAKATNDQRLTDKTLYTAFEQFIGTPAYMSPEQAKLSGLDIDTRSDIYSLGVLLYELLTGTTPFEARRLLAAGLDEIRRIIREEEPVRPSTRLHTLDAAEQTTVAKHRQTDPPKLAHLIRGDLDWIVMKALEKDRGRRYETANGLAMDIQRHLNSEPVVACPPSNFYRFQKLVSRNKLVFAAGAAVGAAILVGLTVSTFLFIQERRAHTRALAAEHDQSQLRLEAVAESKKAKSEAERAQAAERTAAAAAQRAEESAQVATNALQKAEAAATELSLNMAASDFSMAVRLIAERQRDDALAYLARSLALNPKNEAATTRLATLLASQAWWVPRWAFKQPSIDNSVRFSPDGKLIMTSGFGAGVRMWEARSGQRVTTPWNGRGGVVAAFSPDGKRIFMGSINGTEQVWDAQTGQPLTGPLPHKGFVVSAQFSPDGKSILTATTDNRGGWLVVDHAREAASAWVWDAGSGRLVAGPMQSTNRILSAQFSPDGKRILTAGGKVRLWDAGSGQLLGEALKNSGAISSACFSPDGKRILTASSDNAAQVWDAGTGQPVNQPLRHNAQVYSAQYSLDGNRILTASADGTARIWDAQTGEPLGEPLKHSRAVYSAQFSPDGTRIVTANDDFGALVWERVSGPSLAEQPWQGRGHVAQVSADGKRFATTSMDGTARVFDTQTGQPISAPLKHKGAVSSAQFSLDGKRLVTASSEVAGMTFVRENDRWMAHSAWVWDAQSGGLLGGPFRFKDLNFILSAQLSPQGERLATASSDNTARVWDVLSGQPTTEPLTNQAVVNSAAFSQDGKWIVTASDDRTARVWDANSGRALTEPFTNSSEVMSAQFSPDATRIVTAAQDGTVRIWDVRSGQPLTGILHHGGLVRSAQFSPNGKWIVTASDDGTARVWDAVSGQPLTEPLVHNAKVYSAQFSPDGQRVITFAEGGRPRLWDLAPPAASHPDWLAQLAEAVSGEYLNDQGLLEPTKLDRGEVLNQLRQTLNQASDDDDWVRWGRWFMADPSTRTISPFSKVSGSENFGTRSAMKAQADAYYAAGRGPEAIALLAKACELDPTDSDASLTLATWQTWFGQDADYEATRRLLLQQAAGTDQAGTAERTAKAACVGPSVDTAMLSDVLNLAQRGVELGRNSSTLPWYQLALGMADYRNGQYDAAEQILAVAAQKFEELDFPHLLGISRLFRTMSLFRLGRPEEARKLFSQAELQMPAYPPDEHKPLLNGKPASHDYLICWIAYKEAKTLLKETRQHTP
jgi:WD40 repeat protein/serine/threonine protein kinase